MQAEIAIHEPFSATASGKGSGNALEGTSEHSRRSPHNSQFEFQRDDDLGQSRFTRHWSQ